MSQDTIAEYGNQSIRDRCIPFSGRIRAGGYGRTQFLGKQYLAHRLAYALNEYMHPNELNGLVIRHKCDNPACINVDHLEVGSQADNMADMTMRGRRAVGEMIGNSKLTAQKVNEIRSEYVPYSKHANQYQLAKKYGVTQSQISHVIASKRWSHIQKEPK